MELCTKAVATRHAMQLAREWPPGAQCSRRPRVLLWIYRVYVDPLVDIAVPVVVVRAVGLVVGVVLGIVWIVARIPRILSLLAHTRCHAANAVPASHQGHLRSATCADFRREPSEVADMGVVELTAVRIPNIRERRPVLPPTVGGADIWDILRVSRHIHDHGPLLTTGDAFSDSRGHGVLARREPSGVPGSLVGADTAVEPAVGSPPDVRQRIIVGIGCVDTEIDKVPLSARSVERCCADGGVSPCGVTLGVQAISLTTGGKSLSFTMTVTWVELKAWS